MDSWKLKFNHGKSPAGDNLVAIFIKATFEGNEMPFIFNIDGWDEAIESNGKKPMFTCECGNFGCGGYFIDVNHTAEGMKLINSYNPLEQSQLIEGFEYYITWEDVYLIFKEVVDYIEEISNKYKGYQVCIGTYGANLLNKINKYYRTIDKLKIRY